MMTLRKSFYVVSCLCFSAWMFATPASAEVSCEKWNTYSFFSEADEADVSRCLRAGADVNARGKSGIMPLHRAGQVSKSPAVVTALLTAGAGTAARDKKGKTPWDYAEQNAALKDTAPYWRLNEERFR